MDERHMKPVILIFALTTLLSACASRTGTDAAIGGALGGGTGHCSAARLERSPAACSALEPARCSAR